MDDWYIYAQIFGLGNNVILINTNWSTNNHLQLVMLMFCWLVYELRGWIETVISIFLVRLAFGFETYALMKIFSPATTCYLTEFTLSHFQPGKLQATSIIESY